MKKVTFLLFFMANLLSFKASATSFNPVKVDSMGVDSLKLMDFVGKYTFAGLPFEAVEVTIKEAGKIHFVAGSRVGDVPPMKDKPNSFQTPEAVITFVRDEKNVVVKLLIDTGSDTYEGPKVVK